MTAAPHVMVHLAGGEFFMGQTDGRDEERPVHRICVSPFGLATTQVTNAQYDLFCAATRRPRPQFRMEPSFDQPNQPVVATSWFDAVAYCEWLTSETGTVFRLPTEAEWEWAARGGLEGCVYPWGNGPVTERQNYDSRWRMGPEPVATAEPNGYGLFDMCENVHEWCADWFDPGYYAVSVPENPRGPERGSRRASRGGSWRHQIKIARCAARSSIPPEFKYADYGFRVASPSGNLLSRGWGDMGPRRDRRCHTAACPNPNANECPRLCYDCPTWSSRSRPS